MSNFLLPEVSTFALPTVIISYKIHMIIMNVCSLIATQHPLALLLAAVLQLLLGQDPYLFSVHLDCVRLTLPPVPGMGSGSNPSRSVKPIPLTTVIGPEWT